MEFDTRVRGSDGFLLIRLLGGFRVERPEAGEVSEWHRRSAKALTKLLATRSEHALHREEIVELLWPGVEIDSALNSFGKALHAARRALEPDLPRRGRSSYLRMTDSMLCLDTARAVIDADQFQKLAEDSLRRGDISTHERALAAYGGELLPEDRYEDWCADRRGFLAELRVQVLLNLASSLEARGLYNRAAEYLREVIRQDPVRESVHRQLMRLYARMGTPDQSVRQFHRCEDVLRRELGIAPHRETQLVYKEVVASGVAEPQQAPPVDDSRVTLRSPVTTRGAPDAPFIGRTQLLRGLGDDVVRRQPIPEALIVITGEAGVGKTRLLGELAADASRRGALVLWGGTCARPSHFERGPFAVALEGLAASRSAAECADWARRYPPLARFIPSLRTENGHPGPEVDVSETQFDLVTAIVRLLSDLAQTQPVLLVLGDLQDIDSLSTDLICYLAHVRRDRRWMLIGSLADTQIARGCELSRTLELMKRDRLCRTVELQCLSRRDTDALVLAKLPAAAEYQSLLDEVFDLSRGNPRFTCELAEHIDASARSNRSANGRNGSALLTTPVPERLRAVAEVPLAALETIGRRVLELIAVGGSDVSLSTLRAGAGALEPPVSGPELFDALDCALRMHLLEERSSRYSFRHPIIRSVVQQSLAAHRREQLHTALAGTGVGKNLHQSGK